MNYFFNNFFSISDPQQNEYTENKINIQQWLQKLPERKRSLVSYFLIFILIAGLFHLVSLIEHFLLDALVFPTAIQVGWCRRN